MVTALIVYGDDMIIAGKNKDEAKKLEYKLASYSEVKNPGPLKYFLRIEIAQSTAGLIFTQHKYILDLLAKTNHLHVIRLIHLVMLITN